MPAPLPKTALEQLRNYKAGQFVRDMERQRRLLQRDMRKASKAGDHRTVASMAGALAKIQALTVKTAVQANEIVTKEALALYMAAVCEIITRHVKQAIPEGWEVVTDAIAADVLTELGEVRNNEKDQKRLEHMASFRKDGHQKLEAAG